MAKRRLPLGSTSPSPLNYIPSDKGTISKRRRYYWIRKQSGVILYKGVQQKHIVAIVEKFETVLLSKHKNHALTFAAYAPGKSEPGKADVQCHFGNKITGQTHELLQRSNAKRNGFELDIDGNRYEPTLDDNITGTDWISIEIKKNHSRSAERSLTETKELVNRFLQLSTDENVCAFRSVMHGRPLLLGPCKTRTASSPCIIMYQDCWRKTFTKDQLLQMSLAGLSRGSAYRTDNAHGPAEEDEPFHAIALRQVLGGVKENELAHCIFNIPIEEEFSMGVPPDLRSDLKAISSNSANITANIAAQGFVVDLHIDHGMSALSTVFHDCIKLWVLYPPTDENLDEFYKLHGQERKFSRLVNVLQEGVCAITTQGYTLYMPPGWLHATLTVQAGSLLGIKWTCSSDLPVVANVFAREVAADLDETSSQASWCPLLETCNISISTSTNVDDVLKILCPHWKDLGTTFKGNKDAAFPAKEHKEMFKRFKRGKTCPGCNQSIASHETLKKALTR